MMKKKWYLLFVAMVSMLVLAACGGSNSDANSSGDAGGGNYEWDFSHFFPPSHFMEDVVQDLAADLEEQSDVRIQITSYPGASLAAPDEHFYAAETRSVDIALSVNGYTPNQFSLTSVMELPFMSTSSVEGTKP